MNHDSICREFCNSLSVREIRNGYAISTPYKNFLGDDLAFYALRNPEGEGFRLFDDGTIVPHLEAQGATLDNTTRLAALWDILNSYSAGYDDHRGELYMHVSGEQGLARAALDFMAIMLRVNDLLFMIQERAESTFREDVRNQVFAAFSGKANIVEAEAVTDDLSEIIPDMVIRAGERDPVALFIATSPTKLHEAIELHLLATHEHPTPIKVIAMLESDNSIAGKVRVRADNRLDAVLRFRSEEKAAIERMQREVFGWKAVSRLRAH